jgi:hypothetical protein
MVQKEDCPQRSAYRESGFVLSASSSVQYTQFDV